MEQKLPVPVKVACQCVIRWRREHDVLITKLSFSNSDGREEMTPGILPHLPWCLEVYGEPGEWEKAVLVTFKVAHLPDPLIPNGVGHLPAGVGRPGGFLAWRGEVLVGSRARGISNAARVPALPVLGRNTTLFGLSLPLFSSCTASSL